MSTRHRWFVALLSLSLVGPLLAGSCLGQPIHGEVTTVDGQALHVQLDDSITVDPGTTGRVVEERTVGGETVQMSFAVVTVDRVEHGMDEPWVAICPIDRQSEDLQVGDHVRFEEVHPRARIAVFTTPPNVTVSLDGVEGGTTPLRGPVAAGAHDLELQRDGYHPRQHAITIDRGERRELRDTLQTATGTLVVNSLPDSAAVQLDGRSVGRTPVSTELQNGTYTVHLQREGYRSMERAVTVPTGEETSVNVSLRRPLEVELADDPDDEVVNAQLSREGHRLVLAYDLVGEADAYSVSLQLSTNGGKTFESIPETVAGATGDDVPPGRDKQVVWAVLEDVPDGLVGSGNRLRLAVEPERGNRLFWVLGGSLAAGAGATAAAVLGVFGGSDGGGGGEDGGGLPTSPPAPPN